MKSDEKKPFDCVEMKRRAQAIVMNRLAKMTPDEQLSYWQRRNEELGASLEIARRERERRIPAKT